MVDLNVPFMLHFKMTLEVLSQVSVMLNLFEASQEIPNQVRDDIFRVRDDGYSGFILIIDILSSHNCHKKGWFMLPPCFR